VRSFHIRPADPARDREMLCGFILGLQEFEFGIEPNRRLDAAVGAEHLDVLAARIAEHGGEMLIAEDDSGAPLGWAVVHEGEDDLFVLERERRFALVAELYLVPQARGAGAGRALLAACEDWARGRGIGLLTIGVLSGNARARAVYERAGFAPYSQTLRKRIS
jgi:GNAT superfamily N-acetyltransferase